jgi:hypothetical protein
MTMKRELGSCNGTSTPSEGVEEAYEAGSSDSGPRSFADRRVLRSRYLAVKSRIGGIFLFVYIYLLPFFFFFFITIFFFFCFCGACWRHWGLVKSNFEFCGVFIFMSNLIKQLNQACLFSFSWTSRNRNG